MSFIPAHNILNVFTQGLGVAQQKFSVMHAVIHLQNDVQFVGKMCREDSHGPFARRILRVLEGRGP